MLYILTIFTSQVAGCDDLFSPALPALPFGTRLDEGGGGPEPEGGIRPSKLLAQGPHMAPPMGAGGP